MLLSNKKRCFGWFLLTKPNWGTLIAFRDQDKNISFIHLCKEFWFCIEEPNTLFSSSYAIFLQVENGNVQSHFDFGGGPQSLRLRNYDVADGKWHKILIRRNGNFVAMLIDDEHEINGQAPGSHTNININSALEIVLGAQLLPGQQINLEQSVFLH